MTAPKKTDPLTYSEVFDAAHDFFELFEAVIANAPHGTTLEDAIKFSESIFAYAHQLRAIEAEEDQTAPFGFNKKEPEK